MGGVLKATVDSNLNDISKLFFEKTGINIIVFYDLNEFPVYQKQFGDYKVENLLNKDDFLVVEIDQSNSKGVPKFGGNVNPKKLQDFSVYNSCHAICIGVNKYKNKSATTP